MKNIEKLSKQESEKVYGGVKITNNNGKYEVFLQNIDDLEKYGQYLTDTEYDIAFVTINEDHSEYQVTNQNLINIIVGGHQGNRMNRKLDAKDPDYDPKRRK